MYENEEKNGNNARDFPLNQLTTSFALVFFDSLITTFILSDRVNKNQRK
jgi:hypothetical protein